MIFVAYRSLGQEVFCSVQEADYEIARYARQHSSMGILGQDTDFIIYDRYAKMITLLYFWTLLNLNIKKSYIKLLQNYLHYSTHWSQLKC